ncbi:MAG: acyl-CoA synthetase [Deltaproteobacteria bacterium]|nr:acyl-CoA synthetase [Deltaproteobacteria bacterium]
MSWNMGDILDAVAGAVPADAPALIYGEQTRSWSEFDARSNALARQLLARGLQRGDKVAFYLRNQPAYLETLAACFKAGLVHVNVNFRYREEELRYILENSDARAVVFAGEFAEVADKLRSGLDVGTWIQVDDGAPMAGFAESYEELAAPGDGSALDVERSGDDLLLLYTGGTTGMPKGVMWPQGDLWEALGGGASAANGNMRPEDLAAHRSGIAERGAGPRQLPACPLMHGTGLFTAIGTLLGGGCVVTLESPGFDPDELWGVVEKHGVNSLAIVGDAFAKPMLRALDESPGRYRLDSLQLIVSSGVMFSTEVKRGILGHHPPVMLVDSFGSSEAVGFGSSVMTSQGEVKTARFQIGEHVKVFSERDEEIAPGSGEPGFVARGGAIPLGYYKDAEKTAQTFRTIGGVRYSIPGDWCRVELDGTLTLLGRGSVCINTAGEKVYPEEVEEVLKTHPDVDDALVVGLADDRWGQAVTGVVQLAEGARLDEDGLRDHVRERLAGFKVPKRVLRIDRLGRAANGKADYAAVTEYARRELAVD